MKGAEKILLYKHNIERAQRAHGKSNGRDRKRGRIQKETESAERSTTRKREKSRSGSRDRKKIRSFTQDKESNGRDHGRRARQKKKRQIFLALLPALRTDPAGTAETVQPERLPETLQTEKRNTRVINALQTAAEAPGKHTTRGKVNCYINIVDKRKKRGKIGINGRKKNGALYTRIGGRKKFLEKVKKTVDMKPLMYYIIAVL